MAAAGVVAMTTGLMMLAASGAATATPGDPHKVWVCHATSSDTNPYVSIFVDEASTRFKGHLMHKDDPNKTWKSGGEWNGDAHVAGDLKPDFIDGLDGFVFSEEDCTEDSPPTLECPEEELDCERTAVEPSVEESAECEVDGSYTIPDTEDVQYFLDDEPIDPGTYSGPAEGEIQAEIAEDAEGDLVLTNPDFSVLLSIPAAEDCPSTILDVCPNIAGNQAEVPDGMEKVNGECAEPPLGTETASPTPDKKPTVKGTEAVPTAVDAGIGGSGPTMTGTSPIDLLAHMLVGGGLALLMAAGWLQIGRQTRGVHQA